MAKKKIKVCQIMDDLKDMAWFIKKIEDEESKSFKKFNDKFCEEFTSYNMDFLKENLDIARSTIVQIGARLNLDESFNEAMIEVDKKIAG